MMKRNKNARPKPQNAFERETERRRREMLRNLAGFRVNLPRKLLRTHIASGIKPVVTQDKKGNDVFLTLPNTRPNPFRAIARSQSHPTKEPRA